MTSGSHQNFDLCQRVFLLFQVFVSSSSPPQDEPSIHQNFDLSQIFSLRVIFFIPSVVSSSSSAVMNLQFSWKFWSWPEIFSLRVFFCYSNSFLFINHLDSSLLSVLAIATSMSSWDLVRSRFISSLARRSITWISSSLIKMMLRLSPEFPSWSKIFP